MIGGLAALILLSATLSLIQAAEVPEQLSLTVADVGGNVTFQCPTSTTESRFFMWYKQPLGYMVQVVAKGTYTQATLSAQFNSSRFEVTQGQNYNSLLIRNVSKEDEATYFCEIGGIYAQSFDKSFYLIVNDRNQQKSVHVEQTPETASAPPGGSVNLQCSLLSKDKEVQCPGEHRAYWFRAGSGRSLPGVVYTPGTCSDEEEERSCVYSLSKTIQNSSDDGTYYCAVVTCAGILFGEGTKVETAPAELFPVLIVLGGMLACSVTVIVLLIFCKNQRTVCEHCKAGAKRAVHRPGHDSLTGDRYADLDGDPELENYAAVDFSSRKNKKGKKKTESPEECVYSAVRADPRL